MLFAVLSSARRNTRTQIEKIRTFPDLPGEGFNCEHGPRKTMLYA